MASAVGVGVAAGGPAGRDRIRGSDGTRVAGGGPVAGFALLTVAVLAVSLRMPAGTAVVGLAGLGILHNVLELRYMAGRFEQVLHGAFLRLLAALITGIVLCRVLPASAATRDGEILLAYGLLAVACAHALRHRPRVLAAAGALIAAAATASLSFPAYHFVVLTHLHNVVPLVFLWEWSRGMGRGRRLFRAVQTGWVVVIPALVLAGAFDPLMGAGSGWTARLSAAYTPPAWLHSGAELRFVTVFAFMALMHYLVWVWFMPRYAPDATAAFEQRVPVLGARRAWALGLGAGAALAALFVSDYDQGTSVYSALASYHAYLEFPVLLMLVLGMGPKAAPGLAPTTTTAAAGGTA
jgi:hypothetical protein